MERLRKDKRTPRWVRDFIAEIGASVIVLGERVQELEEALKVADEQLELENEKHPNHNITQVREAISSLLPRGTA